MAMASEKGKPKGDKRERTREALLAAARALIREKGHERTTMEQVARRAGMTTGAIYGNFRNRDELFIALGQKYWAPISPKVPPGATFAEAMHAFAAATLAALDDRTSAAVGRLTGLAYALKNPELRARVHEVTKDSYAIGAEWLATFDASDLPMPPDVHVRVVHALIEGLVLQRILTPELCPDEVFYEAFAALAPKPRQACRPAARYRNARRYSPAAKFLRKLSSENASIARVTPSAGLNRAVSTGWRSYGPCSIAKNACSNPRSSAIWT
jgi:AcrR family transcriptional regulator